MSGLGKPERVTQNRVIVMFEMNNRDCGSGGVGAAAGEDQCPEAARLRQ
jgi:hypothetical protein